MRRMRICLGLRSCWLILRWGSMLSVAAGSASGAQAALRIEQEHTRRDDPLALLQPVTNLDAIRELSTDDDGTRLEQIARLHEDVLLESCVNDRIPRYGNHVQARRLERCGAVQAWPERTAG